MSDATGHQPIEQRYRESMIHLAQTINRLFNGEAKGKDRATAFVLLVFPFGDREGRCNYISNGASRKDMVALFREMAARFDGQPEQEGRA